MRLGYVGPLIFGLTTLVGGSAPSGQSATVNQRNAADPAADAPVLAYKEVKWPAPATSAAGHPQAWNFVEVAGVAVTPRGRVLVLHRGAGPIMEFESNGKFVRAWGDGMFSEGKVAYLPEAEWVKGKPLMSAAYSPAGCTNCGAHSVRVDPQGNIWVVDAAGHVVYKMDADGKELMRLGTKGVSGTSPKNFNLPTDVAFAPNGDVYVTDGYSNSRVVKYSRDGKYLLEWGKRGDGPGDIQIPHHVAVDAKGTVYVSDRHNMRIQVFDERGTFITQWPGIGQLSQSALFITRDQQMWTSGGVLRSLNGQIMGRVPRVVGGHGIAISDAGDIYIAQLGGGGSVQKFVKQ